MASSAFDGLDPLRPAPHSDSEASLSFFTNINAKAASSSTSALITPSRISSPTFFTDQRDQASPPNPNFTIGLPPAGSGWTSGPSAVAPPPSGLAMSAPLMAATAPSPTLLTSTPSFDDLDPLRKPVARASGTSVCTSTPASAPIPISRSTATSTAVASSPPVVASSPAMSYASQVLTSPQPSSAFTPIQASTSGGTSSAMALSSMPLTTFTLPGSSDLSSSSSPPRTTSLSPPRVRQALYPPSLHPSPPPTPGISPPQSLSSSFPSHMTPTHQTLAPTLTQTYTPTPTLMPTSTPTFTSVPTPSLTPTLTPTPVAAQTQTLPTPASLPPSSGGGSSVLAPSPILQSSDVGLLSRSRAGSVSSLAPPQPDKFDDLDPLRKSGSQPNIPPPSKPAALTAAPTPTPSPAPAVVQTAPTTPTPSAPATAPASSPAPAPSTPTPSTVQAQPPRPSSTNQLTSAAPPSALKVAESAFSKSFDQLDPLRMSPSIRSLLSARNQSSPTPAESNTTTRQRVPSLREFCISAVIRTHSLSVCLVAPTSNVPISIRDLLQLGFPSALQSLTQSMRLSDIFQLPTSQASAQSRSPLAQSQPTPSPVPESSASTPTATSTPVPAPSVPTTPVPPSPVPAAAPSQAASVPTPAGGAAQSSNPATAQSATAPTNTSPTKTAPTPTPTTEPLTAEAQTIAHFQMQIQRLVQAQAQTQTQAQGITQALAQTQQQGQMHFQALAAVQAQIQVLTQTPISPVQAHNLGQAQALAFNHAQGLAHAQAQAQSHAQALTQLQAYAQTLAQALERTQLQLLSLQQQQQLNAEQAPSNPAVPVSIPATNEIASPSTSTNDASQAAAQVLDNSNNAHQPEEPSPVPLVEPPRASVVETTRIGNVDPFSPIVRHAPLTPEGNGSPPVETGPPSPVHTSSSSTTLSPVQSPPVSRRADTEQALTTSLLKKVQSIVTDEINRAASSDLALLELGLTEVPVPSSSDEDAEQRRNHHQQLPLPTTPIRSRSPNRSSRRERSRSCSVKPKRSRKSTVGNLIPSVSPLVGEENPSGELDVAQTNSPNRVVRKLNVATQSSPQFSLEQKWEIKKIWISPTFFRLTNNTVNRECWLQSCGYLLALSGMADCLFSSIDIRDNLYFASRDLISSLFRMLEGTPEQKLNGAFLIYDTKRAGHINVASINNIVGQLTTALELFGFREELLAPIRNSEKLLKTLIGDLDESEEAFGASKTEFSERVKQYIDSCVDYTQSLRLGLHRVFDYRSKQVLGVVPGHLHWPIQQYLFLGVPLAIQHALKWASRGIESTDWTAFSNFDLRTGKLITSAEPASAPKQTATEKTLIDQLLLSQTESQAMQRVYRNEGEWVLTEYAPHIFLKLREYFSIDSLEYAHSLSLSSLCASLLLGSWSNVLQPLQSTARSGSFLFRSPDQRFIVKAIRESECQFLFGTLLSPYFHHIAQCGADTLLPRFLGLYRLRQVGVADYYILVMKNTFPRETEQELIVTEQFDLKGSTTGRTSRAPDGTAPAGGTLKDLDWGSRHMTINTGDLDFFLKRLNNDCKFLEANELLDYSLLVGVHQIQYPTDPVLDAMSSAAWDPVRWGGPRESFAILAPPNTSHSELYFVGLIDILTRYDLLKMGEHTFKSIFINSNSISCVPPTHYRNRFQKYISRITRGSTQARVLSPARPAQVDMLFPTALSGDDSDDENERLALDSSELASSSGLRSPGTISLPVLPSAPPTSVSIPMSASSSSAPSSAPSSPSNSMLSLPTIASPKPLTFLEQEDAELLSSTTLTDDDRIPNDTFVPEVEPFPADLLPIPPIRSSPSLPPANALDFDA